MWLALTETSLAVRLGSEFNEPSRRSHPMDRRDEQREWQGDTERGKDPNMPPERTDDLPADRRPRRSGTGWSDVPEATTGGTGPDVGGGTAGSMDDLRDTAARRADLGGK
jgi:hypothetical protein